ncbi:MAG: autotransporter outer membrane beta-barrel domain-containing protein [Pseudomonadota bacterium]
MNTIVHSCRILGVAIFLGLFAILGSAGSADARNVPGSAAAGIPPLVTASNDLIITDVLSEIRDLSGNGQAQAGKGVRFVALDPEILSDAPNAHRIGQSAVPNFRGFSASILDEGGLGLYTVGHYRDIDAGTELQADLFTFGGFLSYQASRELFLTIGAVGEVSQGTTPFNQGTLDSAGYGVAAGLNYDFGNNISVSALAGYLMLDYETTRGNGAFSGSFDASRYFLDLSGEYSFSWDDHDTITTAGLRYFYQDNDSYVESGGAAVSGFAVSALAATASTKTYFGADPEFRPFAEASGRVNLTDDFEGPNNVVVLDDNSVAIRFGGGFNYSTTGGTSFEVGAGVNLTDDGYNGVDATIRALIAF